MSEWKCNCSAYHPEDASCRCECHKPMTEQKSGNEVVYIWWKSQEGVMLRTEHIEGYTPRHEIASGAECQLLATVERLEKELADLRQPSLAPCGHNDQYCHTEDGGKTIHCYVCEKSRLESALRKIANDSMCEFVHNKIAESALEGKENGNEGIWVSA